jgi:hypothetical protein
MNNKVLIFCFLGLMAVLLSCKDKDAPAPASPVAGLMVINATADTLNYYVNGTRQNNLSFIYPAGATAYTNAIAGTQNYSFAMAGRPQVLFSKSFTLDSGQYYSMFLGGASAANTFLVPDALSAAGALTNDTTATIRFVNLAPNSGALNFVVNAGDTINFKNCTYKTVSPFMVIKAGSLQTIKIYQNGSATPVLDTTFTLAASSIYTVFTSGIPKATVSSAFNTQLLTNY